jgi:hypothetical protein
MKETFPSHCLRTMYLCCQDFDISLKWLVHFLSPSFCTRSKLGGKKGPQGGRVRTSVRELFGGCVNWLKVIIDETSPDEHEPFLFQNLVQFVEPSKNIVLFCWERRKITHSIIYSWYFCFSLVNYIFFDILRLKVRCILWIIAYWLGLVPTFAVNKSQDNPIAWIMPLLPALFDCWGPRVENSWLPSKRQRAWSAQENSRYACRLYR